jgi:two-component system OmpR family response regulator
VLDLGLPSLDGLAVLKRWRANGRTMPVLVLTARGTWQERVEGIEAGADDYLPKPFRMEELIARARALVRRTGGHAAALQEAGELSLDTNRMGVALRGVPVQVTALEYRLLAYLMLHRDRPVPPTELLEHLYGDDDAREANALEAVIARLRRKLGPGVIGTRRGFGYFLERHELAPAPCAGRRRSRSCSRLALPRWGFRSSSAPMSNAAPRPRCRCSSTRSSRGLERGLRTAGPGPAASRSAFSVPYGGLYWQIEEAGGLRRSRSLWDAALDLPADTLGDGAVHVHRLAGPDGADLLVLERSITLPARLGGGTVRAAVAMDSVRATRRPPRLHGRSCPLPRPAGLHAERGGLGAIVGRAPAIAEPRRTDRRPARGADRAHGRRLAGRAAPGGDGDRRSAGRPGRRDRARPHPRRRSCAWAEDPPAGADGRSRTPAQVRRDEQADGIEETARAMRRTVDRELARARSAARASMHVPIRPCRRRPDRGSAAHPGRARLDWQQTIPEGLAVALDEADLAEAMGALAENAARHARGKV